MNNIKRFSSRKEVTEFLKEKDIDTSNWSEEKWLSLNKGQAEIHIMDLAECIYDAMNESTPRQLKAGDWHLPMLPKGAVDLNIRSKLKWCVGIHANTSYTVVGDGKELTLEHSSKIHDKCLELNHSSVFEHCARAMSSEEYRTFIKGECSVNPISEAVIAPILAEGWCRNFKGFIQYRHILETKGNLC